MCEVGGRAVVRFGIFLFVMGAASVAAAVVGYRAAGRAGLECALLAAGVCVVAGGVSLVLREAVVNPRWALLHVLVGFFFRMGLPLTVCMVVYWRGGPLVEAGFVFYLLGLYLMGLMASTALGVGTGARAPKVG